MKQIGFLLALAFGSYTSSSQQYFGVELPASEEQEYYPSIESRKKAILDNLPQRYLENDTAKRFVESNNK